MQGRKFEKGLHDLGNGIWAYLQPDGSWGWSNAGLVVDGEAALLVDTLYDERLTGEMLASMRDAAGVSARDIDLLVNTHANGDHTYGNGLVEGATVIASAASARQMDEEMPPQAMAALLQQKDALGLLGEYAYACFGAFDYEGISLKQPDRTFAGELILEVGGKQVHLIEVGPAHTAGDVLVHVPSDRTVFTGDILFIDGTPIMWEGPVGNWIRACDRILEMDVEAIVPGHGPITDKQGVRDVKEYLAYIDREARARFDAGLSEEQAVKDIDMGRYSHWLDCERIVVNVNALYREYRGDSLGPDIPALFARMAELWAEHRSS